MFFKKIIKKTNVEKTKNNLNDFDFFKSECKKWGIRFMGGG